MNKKATAFLTLCIYLLSACFGIPGICSAASGETASLKTQAQNEFLQNGMIVLADFSNLSSAEQEKNALVTVESTDGATADISTEHTMSQGATSALKLGNLSNGSLISIKSKYNLDLLPTSYQIWMMVGINADGDNNDDKIPIARYVDVGGAQTAQNLATFTLNDKTSGHDKFEREFLNKSTTTDTQTLIDGLAEESGSNELKFCLKVRANITGDINEVYVEKIYLKVSGWGQTLAEPTAQTNGTSDVIYETLDGSNAYSFTFAEKLYAGEEAVSVYEVTSSGEALTQQTYTVTINNEKLKIQFADSVAPYVTYKIKLDKTKIISVSGKMLAEDVTEEFYVLNSADIFDVVSTTPANGASLSVFPETVTVSFTKNVAPLQEISDCIHVCQDGEKLYNAYGYSVADDTVTLEFASGTFTNGEYKILIDKSLVNTVGNELLGDYEFTFNVSSGVQVPQTIDVFEAGDPTHMGDASGISVESDGSLVNLYPVTARRNYGADASVTAKFYDEQRSFDATDMNYLNLWLYSPKSSQDPINISCYTSFANNQYRLYQLPSSWVGWKLVSLPLGDFSNSSQGKNFERVYVNIGGWSTGRDEAGYILIDRIWFSKNQPSDFSLKFVSMADGTAGAKIVGEQIIYDFTKELDSGFVPEVVISGSAPVPAASVSADGTMAVVTFGELTPGAQYSVTLKNVLSADGSVYASTPVLDFTAASEGVYLNDVTFSGSAAEGAENNITFDFDIFGSSAHTLQTVVYAPDADKGFAGEMISSSDISVLSDSASLSFISPWGTSELKAFVLDSAGNIVSNKIVTLKGSTKSEELLLPLSGSKMADIKTAYLNSNIVTIKAALGGTYGGALLSVTSADGSYTACKDVLVFEKDGTCSYNFRMPNSAQSGEYNITLGIGSVTDSETMYYLDKADRDLLVTLSNGTNTSALASFISAHKKAFGFSSLSAEYADDIAKLTIGEASFEGYTRAREYILALKAEVDAANGGVWSEITDIIKNNSAFFGGNTDAEYQYFTNLAQSEKNKVSVNMCSYIPASSITALNQAFEKAVADYKASLDLGDSSYSPGSSGSVIGGFTPSNPTGQTPQTNETVFTDIAGAEWAREYIMYLYGEGIVSKPADGRFRPNDFVTREEFVKMLVSAFYSDFPLSSHSFTDTEAGAWYMEYLSKAYSVGITRGYPDGSFGVGRLITREEMATLCSRAVNALETSVGSEPNFTDAAEISDYAKSHVAALSRMNIINGYLDGTFAPRDNATRAQAAKIIALLLQKF